eukprot:TRINITY_DN3121_c0_g2_i1.p6 TRINITY_DN3121_c0_g2~~TRINITY_DN3121_c0_g2_i1.p6  ORF type:complete len:153 (+),score=7.77 TRINITY_DN3121_c0_g2_i1:2048-2506(+)
MSKTARLLRGNPLTPLLWTAMVEFPGPLNPLFQSKPNLTLEELSFTITQAVVCPQALCSFPLASMYDENKPYVKPADVLNGDAKVGKEIRPTRGPYVARVSTTYPLTHKTIKHRTLQNATIIFLKFKYITLPKKYSREINKQLVNSRWVPFR